MDRGRQADPRDARPGPQEGGAHLPSDEDESESESESERDNAPPLPEVDGNDQRARHSEVCFPVPWD